MRKKDQLKTITPELIRQYSVYLQEQEKSTATIEKYIHNLTALYKYLEGQELTKTALLRWKGHLTEEYASFQYQYHACRNERSPGFLRPGCIKSETAENSDDPCFPTVKRS